MDGMTIDSEHIDDIRGREDSIWSDLLREGVMEWIDAEEEEDTFISVEPYDSPERCPHCGRALSPTDLDWMNPGADSRDVVLKCKHCGGENQGPVPIEQGAYAS